MADLLAYTTVFVLGALVGFVEILSRYKDAPFKVAVSQPGVFYIGINALVAALALVTVRIFGWTFVSDPNASPELIRWTQVLVSGLGAMTLFRSSLFSFHINEQDISIGPNAVLQILLVAVDKEVDRLRGKERARIVEEAMDGISFIDAAVNLPTVAIALLQNLSREDQDEILNTVKTLSSEDAKAMPERAKIMSLGLTILNIVGEDILKAAIDVVNLNNKPVIPEEKPTPPSAVPENDASSKPAVAKPDSDPLKEKLKEVLKSSDSPNVEIAETPAPSSPGNPDPLREKLKEKLK